MTLDVLTLAAAIALSIVLSVLVYWIGQHPNGASRAHLLRMFTAAAAWSWFVTARNVLDVRYDSPVWNAANLALAGLALWATWRCVRWVLR